jgi:hypothetical protein
MIIWQDIAMTISLMLNVFLMGIILWQDGQRKD